MPGLGEGLLGLGAGLLDQPRRLGVGVGDHLLGVGLRTRPGRLGLALGLAEDVVAAVEHVLGVVELARQCLPHVVEQLEDVAAGHHAVGGHRDAPGLLDHGHQRVE